MYIIRQTDEFAAWLASLRDGTTRRRLARRLEKAERGNLGDVKSVGSDKSTQSADIARAIELAATLKE